MTLTFTEYLSSIIQPKTDGMTQSLFLASNIYFSLGVRTFKERIKWSRDWAEGQWQVIHADILWHYSITIITVPHWLHTMCVVPSTPRFFSIFPFSLIPSSRSDLRVWYGNCKSYFRTECQNELKKFAKNWWDDCWLGDYIGTFRLFFCPDVTTGVPTLHTEVRDWVSATSVSQYKTWRSRKPKKL